MSLYSERAGEARLYSSSQIYDIIKSELKGWDISQLFIKAFGGSVIFEIGDSEKPFNVTGDLDKPAQYFRRLLVHTMTFNFSDAPSFTHYLPSDLNPAHSGNLNLLFDVLEILHELAAHPRMSNKTQRLNYSKMEGASILREALNPELALLHTPHQILSNGQIVEISNKPVLELAEQSLQIIDTDGVPELVKEPINHAVVNYIKRGATIAEKKAAVRNLADALESIRPSVKTNLLTADENSLFQTANQFAIRHNDSKQKSDYDKGIWYDWMFHVNLAALITVIKIIKSQKEK